jgi:hypothetical protein
MKKKNFIFPLSLDNIADLLGKDDKTTADIEGVVMIKKCKTNPQIKEAIEEQIFKNVFDEWKSERSVVVGENKLLTVVAVEDYEIKEQAPAIKNFIVMSIKAKVSIEQDPDYAEEIKDGIRTDTRVKFR